METVVSASDLLIKIVGLGFLLFFLCIPLINLFDVKTDLLSIALAFILTIPLHEFMHAVPAYAFRIKPCFGLWKTEKLIAGFYVKLNAELKVKKWLVVALFPLNLSWLSVILASLLMKDLLIWLCILNTASSAGDIALAIFAASSGKDSSVKDLGDKIVIKNGHLSNLPYIFLDILSITGYVSLPLYLAYLFIIRF